MIGQAAGQLDHATRIGQQATSRLGQAKLGVLGGDQDVAPAADRRQVGGPGMADRDRAVGSEQELRHRLADDVGAPDDDRLLPRQVAQFVFQQHHAADRGAGRHRGPAGRESARIDDMEAVDILLGTDRIQDPKRVDLRRQRQLDQNAVDPVVRVQRLDQRQKFRLADPLAETMLEAPHAGLFGRLPLVPDIDAAGRVVADEDDREAGRRAAALRQRAHGGADSHAQSRREALAVDDPCRHRCALLEFREL